MLMWLYIQAVQYDSASAPVLMAPVQIVAASLKAYTLMNLNGSPIQVPLYKN